MLRRFVLAGAVGLAACAAPRSPADTVTGSPPRQRVAAEWEPALGVLVRWPPYLPHRLLVELANDTRLYVMVEDDAGAADARRWFDAWGIDAGRCAFLIVPGSDDAAWPRDYGPHPLFGADGSFALGDARYDKTTPDSDLPCDAPLLTPWNGGWGDRFRDYDITHDDAAPAAIAHALGVAGRVLPFVLTGGNFLTDGRGSAFSTCVLLNENRSNGLADADFLALAARELGIDRYHVLPNFEERGIQHVDCLLKLLDDERILVARAPRDHARFARYEAIVEHLRQLRTPGGRPYEILRLDTVRYAEDRLAAYTNSLILDDVVYVPLFGIAQDEVALATWRAALPGHTVKGFPFVLDDEPAVPARARRMYPDGRGWRDFDALHCRTRAVWDPGMLYLAVDRVPPQVAAGEAPVVVAEIVACSGARLLADRLVLRWSVTGEQRWQAVPLQRGADGRFRARIPAQPPGTIVRYYVAAADTSGRSETAPRTAPAATLDFRVVDVPTPETAGGLR